LKAFPEKEQGSSNTQQNKNSKTTKQKTTSKRKIAYAGSTFLGG